MAVGFAIHLNADLFPSAWIGFATIKLPLDGHLGCIVVSMVTGQFVHPADLVPYHFS
jgi:hypothetical protein